MSRDAAVTARLSQAERLRVELAAEAEGLTLSEFIRDRVVAAATERCAELALVRRGREAEQTEPAGR
jgi:uncharacterized protein (DUF1778 family)